MALSGSDKIKIKKTQADRSMDNGSTGRDTPDQKPIRRSGWELIIVTAIAVIGAALVLVFFLMKKPGTSVIVSVDGKETARYELDKDTDIVLQGVGGTNRLIISGGTARIEEADCPDKLCVHQGGISDVGESIICLPHHVSVRIEGDGADDTDAVVR